MSDLLVLDSSFVATPWKVWRSFPYYIKVHHSIDPDGGGVSSGVFDILLVTKQLDNAFFARTPDAALSDALKSHSSLLSASISDFYRDILESSGNESRLHVSMVSPSTVSLTITVPVNVHAASAIPSIDFKFRLKSPPCGAASIVLHHFVTPLARALTLDCLLTSALASNYFHDVSLLASAAPSATATAAPASSRRGQQQPTASTAPPLRHPNASLSGTHPPYLSFDFEKWRSNVLLEALQSRRDPMRSHAFARVGGGATAVRANAVEAMATVASNVEAEDLFGATIAADGAFDDDADGDVRGRDGLEGTSLQSAMQAAVSWLQHPLCHRVSASDRELLEDVSGTIGLLPGHAQKRSISPSQLPSSAAGLDGSHCNVASWDGGAPGTQAAGMGGSGAGVGGAVKRSREPPTPESTASPPVDVAAVLESAAVPSGETRAHEREKKRRRAL